MPTSPSPCDAPCLRAVLVSRVLWSVWLGSNQRPPASKAGRLPTDITHRLESSFVGLAGFSPATSGYCRRRRRRLASPARPARRCHLRRKVTHILQASITWTSAPERRLGKSWSGRPESNWDSWICNPEHGRSATPTLNLAKSAGLEPGTSDVTGRRSNQLS